MAGVAQRERERERERDDSLRTPVKCARGWSRRHVSGKYCGPWLGG
jgi:hypothetical protein